MPEWVPVRTPALYYVVQPNNTALWVPWDVMQAVGAKERDRLTADQWSHPVLQGLLEQRRGGVSKKER